MANVTYNSAKEGFTNGALDWDAGGQTYTCLLVGTGYTPNPDHNFVSDVVANEAAGGTYVRKTVTGRTVVKDNTNDRAQLNAADIVWTALDVTSGQLGGAIIFLNTGSDGTSILVAYFDFIPDRSTNGGDFTVQFPNGALRVS